MVLNTWSKSFLISSKFSKPTESLAKLNQSILFRIDYID
jgi:hypothetical protein